MTTLELTEAQRWQLIISLKNDWIDNDQKSKMLIERILNKLGETTK